MNAVWIIPFIIIGGAVQTCGAAMNGQLHKSLGNPARTTGVVSASDTVMVRGALG